MEKQLQSRYNYIDIARGLALVLVVLGHLVQCNSKTFNWIFSFHMPLFFIISGMCYELKEQPKFTKYIKKKIKTLIIPYFMFLLLGFVISYIVKVWRVNAISPHAFKLAFYYTQPEFFHVGQIWFLVALFVSSTLLYIVHKYIIEKQDKLIEKNIANILLIGLFVFLGFSVIRVIYIPEWGRLPWKIDASFMATAFMLFGCFLKRNDFRRLYKNKKIMSAILAIIFALINYRYGAYKNGYVNLCDCIYGVKILWYFISAIFGSMTVILIASIIEKNKVIEYYGKNSLFMFAIHSLFLSQTQWALSKIYNKNYIIMNNIPLKLCLISTISILIILFPLTLIYNKFKSFLKIKK